MPQVTVGLAVYNGERYLEEAIDSILGQSFQDLELVISDNASTDATEQICRKYAAQDQRVRYYRNDTNLGAAKNFNRAYSLARGEYFMWAAHDDVYHKEYVCSCLQALQSDSGLSLAYTQEAGIDDEGNNLGQRPYLFDTSLSEPEDRFLALLYLDRGSPPIFGLMPTELLRKTSLIGLYDGSDQTLLAELALYGRFYQVQEDYLFHREHSGRSVYECRDRHSATVWFDTSKERKIVFPQWRWFIEYCRVILSAPINLKQKAACGLHMLRWLKMRDNARKMFEDLLFAAKAVVQITTRSLKEKLKFI